MKFSKLLSGVAFALGVASSANAFVLYAGGTALEDDNLERMVKGQSCANPNTAPGQPPRLAGTVCAGLNAQNPGLNLVIENNSVAGVLEVGDRLTGVIEFPKIRQSPSGASQFPISPELTGIFDTEVYVLVPNAGDPTLANILWGPTASFMGTYGAGAMVAMYTGGTDLDTNNCLSVIACETAASDGNLWAIAGYGDADDQWISRNSLLAFGSGINQDQNTALAQVNYALSILTNNTGYQFNEQSLKCQPSGFFACAGDGKTDLIGSGQVLGGEGLTNGFGAVSDIDLTLNVVPEPGSLALFALSLAGLGLVMRRRAN